MAKQKKQSSGSEKDAARARKSPRTEARKAARRSLQDLQRQTNVVRRHMGVPTPWERAKAKRAGTEVPEETQGSVELAA